LGVVCKAIDECSLTLYAQCFSRISVTVRSQTDSTSAFPRPPRIIAVLLSSSSVFTPGVVVNACTLLKFSDQSFIKLLYLVLSMISSDAWRGIGLFHYLFLRSALQELVRQFLYFLDLALSREIGRMRNISKVRTL